MILPYYGDDEKRHFSRMKVDVPAEIQSSDSEYDNVTATCLDLSGGGMLIEANLPLAVGAEVTVTIKSTGENGPVLHAATKVTRTLPSSTDRKCLMGLKIEQILN